MKEACNPNYYTLELIPKYRQDYITTRLNWLVELLKLKKSNWPLDCLNLLEQLKALQPFPFHYEFTFLPKDCDAAAEYSRQYNLYLIFINNNKASYPYDSSQNRRLNFTLAHELGHIALGHLSMPPDKKGPEDIKREELEADEFAGRLLMPEKLIFSMNYYSLSSASEYLQVSKKALWTRLNNLKRLNLLNSKPIKTCSTCGNTKFSIFSEYCGICGQPLEMGLNGIRIVFYPSDIQTDKLKRAVECPLCKSKHIKEDKCQRCGTYIFNYCSEHTPGLEEGCSYANNSNFRFCEMCGKPTYYYKRGLLKPWEEELNAALDYV